MRFDYLRSARPVALARIFDVRVPQRFHAALAALGAGLAIVAGACAIEAYRLHEALRVQALYERRYDDVRAQLRQSTLYYDRVRAMVALDRRVRRITASGYADARTLAAIANGLPPHVWLTAIAHDAAGVSLAGHARDLSVLSKTMRGLMRMNELRAPALVRASEEKLHGHAGGLTYEIHLDGTTQ